MTDRQTPTRRSFHRPVQWIIAGTATSLLLSGLLAGCSWIGTPSGSTQGYVKGFGGAIAADEPQAALQARDVLVAGGSAADAAVAAYFTMAVTYPGAASLGSGGVCLVYDSSKEIAEVLDFTHPNAGARGTVPLPASPRGMLALHAKYGRLPWTQLIGPAEAYARLGHPASRAFARTLAAAPDAVADPAMAGIFADKSGNPVAAGGRILQTDLAQTIGLIRRQPTRFYSGAFAEKLANAYRAAGADLRASDLSGFAPRFRPAITVARGNQTAFFPPTPAGLVTAQIWAMLFREGAWADASPETRAHLIAEVSRRAYADAGRWLHNPTGVPGDAQSAVAEERIRALLESYRRDRKTDFQVPGTSRPMAVPPDQGSASVIAADRFGQAVACAFTMNGAFGRKTVAPGTGILVAAAPDPEAGSPALSLMALGFGSQWQLEYMGVGTGGAAAPVSVATGAARMMLERRTVEEILDMPRLTTEGLPDRIMIEDRDGAGPIAADLAARGHDVRTMPELGRMNVLACPAGFSGDDSQCDIRTDRRGSGFAQLF